MNKKNDQIQFEKEAERMSEQLQNKFFQKLQMRINLFLGMTWPKSNQKIADNKLAFIKNYRNRLENLLTKNKEEIY